MGHTRKAKPFGTKTKGRIANTRTTHKVTKRTIVRAHAEATRQEKLVAQWDVIGKMLDEVLTKHEVLTNPYTGTYAYRAEDLRPIVFEVMDKSKILTKSLIEEVDRELEKLMHLSGKYAPVAMDPNEYFRAAVRNGDALDKVVERSSFRYASKPVAFNRFQILLFAVLCYTTSVSAGDASPLPYFSCDRGDGHWRHGRVYDASIQTGYAATTSRVLSLVGAMLDPTKATPKGLSFTTLQLNYATTTLGVADAIGSYLYPRSPSGKCETMRGHIIPWGDPWASSTSNFGYGEAKVPGWEEGWSKK